MITSRLAALTAAVEPWLRHQAHATESVADERAGLERAQAELADAEAALALAQEVAEGVQQAAVERIAAVVGRCLQAVFGVNAYTFRLEFERPKGRKTEAVIVLERDGVVLREPLTEAGGGVVDVAALACRVVVVLLTGLRRLLILDEPFANVRGRAYRARTRELLLALSRELGFQFVLCTDVEAFRLGRVVELGTEEVDDGQEGRGP